MVPSGSMGAVSTGHGTRRRRLPRLAVAMARLVLALAVVFGMAQSGGRYFYCEALGLMPSDPCAEASGAAQRGPLGTLGAQHTDCCEVLTLATMPPAAQAARPCVPPAPCVALLAAASASVSAPFVVTSGAEHLFERWRPPPRAPNEARAQFMVFLI
jgi:hypothetical protein